MKVAALAGGVGGAKLLVGLQRVCDPGTLTAIVNTADDSERYGVHVSPDVDIVSYWLAGIADEIRGWGIAGDSFDVVDALASLGEDAWFRLGDRDLATCLFRSERLRAGCTLTEVTEEIRSALGVPSTILPMSDDRVRTEFTTVDGHTLEFQEYFVREACEPEIAEIHLAGSDDARPGPGVIEAIQAADRVVLCPSNPVVSIGPILAMPGIRDALRAHRAVAAVTPIVQGRPIKGPADKLLRAVGADVSASGVAALYRDFCDLFVVDATDEAEVDKVGPTGVRAAAYDTLMTDAAASERLAAFVLDALADRPNELRPFE